MRACFMFITSFSVKFNELLCLHKRNEQSNFDKNKQTNKQVISGLPGVI
jgi:hypothetical protein